MGFRYFILHLSLVAEREREEYKTLFSEMFGEPVHEDSELVAYRLGGVD